MKKKVNKFRTPNISVAPMMAWTDRHCRYFHRLISPNSTLYTEMVTTGALVHGDQEKHLNYNQQEHPVVLQLGGSDPKDLAFSAKLGQEYGYDEINLNCGCPSDRVQKGAFGACLMKKPQLVADCIKSMQDAVDIPVTIKCRIGIDDSEEFEFLEQFVTTVSDAGCSKFIIHARKAWLNGLSPKENREIPPLRYDIVRQLKEKYDNLDISVNGGVKTVKDISEHTEIFDGVMVGREAYQNPWVLSQIECEILKGQAIDRMSVAESMHSYIHDKDISPHAVVRHMMGLFKGQSGGRIWRQALSEHAQDPDVIMVALDKMRSC